MGKVTISPDFTIEDIHKIREINYEVIKDMTEQERREYYNVGVVEAQRKIQEIRKRR